MSSRGCATTTRAASTTRESGLKVARVLGLGGWRAAAALSGCPAAPQSGEVVMGADGITSHRYTNQNPQEQWRPIFVLRTGHAHVVQVSGGGTSAVCCVHGCRGTARCNQPVGALLVPPVGSVASESSACGSLLRLNEMLRQHHQVAGSALLRHECPACPSNQTREGVPDGLSVIQHVALGPPALTPFVPVYRVSCATG